MPNDLYMGFDTKLELEFSVNGNNPTPTPCGCPSRTMVSDKPCGKLMACGHCADMPAAICGQFGHGQGNIIKF